MIEYADFYENFQVDFSLSELNISNYVREIQCLS